MAFNEYASFDGLALGRLVREGKITPAELMDAAIARAEKHNAKLNAIVFKDYDRARATANSHKADAAPFAGVPLLLKDIMGDCAGMPTRSACAFIPATPMPADSELVARYKRAGFIPFAKTNAPELGIPQVTESRLYGPAHNPWDLERTPADPAAAQPRRSRRESCRSLTATTAAARFESRRRVAGWSDSSRRVDATRSRRCSATCSAGSSSSTC